MLKSHTLVPDVEFSAIRYELRPALAPNGEVATGLFNAWIVIDNPAQLNSYTTEIAKEIVLAFRQASMDRRVVCVVFTATGDKAFTTGLSQRRMASIMSLKTRMYCLYS